MFSSFLTTVPEAHLFHTRRPVASPLSPRFRVSLPPDRTRNALTRQHNIANSLNWPTIFALQPLRKTLTVSIQPSRFYLLVLRLLSTTKGRGQETKPQNGAERFQWKCIDLLPCSHTSQPRPLLTGVSFTSCELEKMKASTSQVFRFLRARWARKEQPFPGIPTQQGGGIYHPMSHPERPLPADTFPLSTVTSPISI